MNITDLIAQLSELQLEQNKIRAHITTRTGATKTESEDTEGDSEGFDCADCGKCGCGKGGCVCPCWESRTNYISVSVSFLTVCFIHTFAISC